MLDIFDRDGLALSTGSTPPQVACFTSFTYSYLPRACVLAQTLRRAHPDWFLCAVIVDRPPPDIDLAGRLAMFDDVVEAHVLDIPGFASWIFKYNVIEACTAVKGRVLGDLLAAGYPKVVYLDPDIAVFHPLDDVVRKLDEHSIILTPHQVEPNTARDAIIDNEMTSFRYGIYNLGFVAVRNDATGRACAAWWDRMLSQACYEEVETGIYTDQKYFDMVPALFDNVLIERDPGCNVASWNISRRNLQVTRSGDLQINGSPLKFYHFTKIGGIGDTMTERYAGANFEIMEVWHWYKRAIAANDVPGVPPGYWHYANFADGTPIPYAARVLYRQRPDLVRHFQDPFDPAGFRAWIAREAPAVLGAEAANRT